jgi:hypothetical protein
MGAKRKGEVGVPPPRCLFGFGSFWSLLGTGRDRIVWSLALLWSLTGVLGPAGS